MFCFRDGVQGPAPFPEQTLPGPIRGAGGCRAALPWSQIRAVPAVPTAGSLAPINVRLHGFPHRLAKWAARSESSLQGPGSPTARTSPNRGSQAGQDLAGQEQPGRRWDLPGVALTGSLPIALQRCPCGVGNADTRWPGPRRNELPEELGSVPATLNPRQLEREHLFPQRHPLRPRHAPPLSRRPVGVLSPFGFLRVFFVCFCFKYHTNSQLSLIHI